MRLPGAAILLAAFIMSSCSNKPKYIYGTLDFSDSLRPHLEKIVESGVVGYDSSTLFLKQHSTDSELKKLSLSEHPILRLVALRIMQQRDSLDPLDFMMSHLDDNATVAVEEGEFGINFRKIPDVLLRYAQWKIKDNKEKLVERVLLNYNYLHFAYTSMSQFGFEPNEKYYQSIKEMAQRDRPYEEIDCAVYGLAKFKKPEDIKLIAHILYENKWQLGRYSFMLMEKYPDSTYLSILDIYAKTYFSRHFNFHEGETPAIEFFSALASYKRKETAELLPILLNRISRLGCYNDTNYLKMSLFQAFLKNKCEAYSSILPQIEMGLEKTLNKMKAQYSR